MLLTQIQSNQIIMGKPQLTQLPNYQHYQNSIKVKMTILKFLFLFLFFFFFGLKKLSFSFKFCHFLTNQTENREWPFWSFFLFGLKKLSFSFKFLHFLTNQTENREKVSNLRLPLSEASSGFKNPHFPCSKLSLNGNTCPWKPPEPPPPPPRSPKLSWSIIGSGSVSELPKPPLAPVKLASAEAKLGRPRICSRKSSLVAFDGLLAMRCNSLSRTRPSRGESHWRVTSFKEHLQREREREFWFALLCLNLEREKCLDA